MFLSIQHLLLFFPMVMTLLQIVERLILSLVRTIVTCYRTDVKTQP